MEMRLDRGKEREKRRAHYRATDKQQPENNHAATRGSGGRAARQRNRGSSQRRARQECNITSRRPARPATVAIGAAHRFKMRAGLIEELLFRNNI